MQKLYRTVKLDGVKAKSAGEYFGTLQDSITDMWREHLKTTKYSAHRALDEYYNEMPEKVDAFIEAYIACTGERIMDYKCNFQAKNLTPLEYLKLLKAFLEDGREEYCGEHSELGSDLDDILNLIDSTIYKLKELHEGMVDLSAYIKESLDESTNKGHRIYEGKFPRRVNIEGFIELVNAIQDESAGSNLDGILYELGIDDLDEKYYDFLLKHCKIIERGGGYDGNGEDQYTFLFSTVGFNVNRFIDSHKQKNYDDDYEAESEAVDLSFEDGFPLSPAWLKEAGRITGMRNPKIGTTYRTAGFESPTFVIFDQNNSMAKEIMRSLEGSY